MFFWLVSILFAVMNFLVFFIWPYEYLPVETKWLNFIAGCGCIHVAGYDMGHTRACKVGREVIKKIISQNK